MAVIAAPLFHQASTSEKFPICFSSLGCPAWEWTKVLDFAQQNGFASIELRGLQGTMDLPARIEFGPARLAQSKQDVVSRGLRIACVGSSAHLHEMDPEQNKQQLADARRSIDLASSLGCPYVRIFGNEISDARDQVIEHVGRGLRTLALYAAPKNVSVLLESHGDFSNSPTLRSVMEQADSANVGILWDAHHTYVRGKEDPAYTLGQLGKYIHHVHLKDSRKAGDDVRYVLTGRGDVPVRRQVELLAKSGYEGQYSFEWEKAWVPDLEEPEVAIADFARVITQYLGGAERK